MCILTRKRYHNSQLKKKPLKEILNDLSNAIATGEKHTAAQISNALAEMKVSVTFGCDHQLHKENVLATQSLLPKERKKLLDVAAVESIV